MPYWYWHPDLLTQSKLWNFVSYNKYGEQTTSLMNFLYPVPPGSKFIDIGLMVDEHFTEWMNFFDIYQIDMDKPELWLALNMDSVTKFKKEELLDMYWKIHPRKEFIPAGTYNPVKTIIDRVNNIPEIQNIMEESEKQVVLEDYTYNIKWKIDFLHPDYVADLKCVGSMERFMDDLVYKWSLNVHNRYVRQLAWYCYIAKRTEWRLIVIDHSGKVEIISIWKSVLDIAFNKILKDIQLLSDTLAKKDIVKRLTVDTEIIL